MVLVVPQPRQSLSLRASATWRIAPQPRHTLSPPTRESGQTSVEMPRLAVQLSSRWTHEGMNLDQQESRGSQSYARELRCPAEP
eukprot:5489174-Pleurochrysis_carterae.AAC.1